MPLSATNFVTKGPVLHADMLQFFNLFTGVMLDQPVTFKNTLTLGGNQGSSTVPLKIYGAVGQTGHLLDLYADTGQAQPGFGFGAAGNFAWGPGGVSPQDTFLSRVATQNGHASDTAGLLVQPYLEVAGPIQANSYQFANGATLTGPGANPFQLTINQDLVVNRNATVNQDLRVNRSLGVGGAPSAATAHGSAVFISSNSGTNPQSLLSVGTSADPPLQGVPGTSTAAAMSLGPTMQAVANGVSLYGGYWTPFWSAGGFTGLVAIGLFIGPQPTPAGFDHTEALHLTAPTGGTGNNYSLVADGGAGIMGPVGIGTMSTTTAQAQQHLRLIVAGTATVGPQNYGAIVQVGGQVNVSKAGDGLYGEYFQPTLNAAGQANITAVGMVIAPVIQGSPSSVQVLSVGGAQGGTASNYSLQVSAAAGTGAISLYVTGGLVQFPANSLNGSCIIDGQITTSKLAAQAANVVQQQVAAPAGTTTTSTWTPAPEPFGTTGIVVNIIANDVVLIDATVSVVSAQPNQAVFIGAGVDGTLSQNLGIIWTQGANLSATGSFHVAYIGPPAGSHRYVLWWALAVGTTMSWNQSIYTTFRVTVVHKGY